MAYYHHCPPPDPAMPPHIQKAQLANQYACNLAAAKHDAQIPKEEHAPVAIQEAAAAKSLHDAAEWGAYQSDPFDPVLSYQEKLAQEAEEQRKQEEEELAKQALFQKVMIGAGLLGAGAIIYFTTRR